MTDFTPAAAILTAAFGHTPAAPSSQTIPTSAPTAAPTAPAVPVEPHSHAGLSETDHAAMVGSARQDVASGKLSSEDATKLFDDLGVPADQRLIDEQFSAGRAQDFRLAYTDPGRPAPP